MLVPTVLRNRQVDALYILTFFINIHAALPAYVNSTFISQFIPENLVGLLYVVAAFASIGAFLYLPKILNRFGNFKTAVFFLLLEIGTVLILAFVREPILLIVALISSIVFIRIVGYNADVFLESYSDDETTGETRGFFLAATNFAWVIAPLIGGFILGDNLYSRLYLSSVLFLIPFFFVLIGKFKNFKDPKYRGRSIIQGFHKLERRSNIRKIVMANVVLRFFYSWMIIYTPIYLHQHIGLAWDEIGIILTIMLVPFVLFEAPLGWLADKKFGEKELLTIGFVITAIATASLTFISATTVWIWAALLFMTRVGASFVESMNETYFFKKTDTEDSDLLSFFRMGGFFAYTFSPVVATVVLYLLDFRYLFLVLGIIVLWGLKYSLTIQDTR